MLAIKKFERHFSALYFASEALKNDIEFVKEVLKHDEKAFMHISESLKCDKNIVLYALQCNNNVLICPFVEEKYNNDRDVVMLSMKIDGWDIAKASKKLRKDFDILIESAITSGSHGLHRLPKRRLPFLGEHDFQNLGKNEKELYIIDYLYDFGDKLKSYGQNSYPEYYFISKKLALAIISCNCKKDSQLKAFNSIPNVYRNDKEVIMHAIKKKPKLFEFIDDSFKTDKEVLDLLPEK